MGSRNYDSPCIVVRCRPIFSIINILAPQYSIHEGKILKTKQVRSQRHLLGGESVVEGDHISPLESHRQPLEQVRCFPGVFSDGCHSSAQLLHQFHCLVVPGPGCLYGNWYEDVAVGQLHLFGFLVTRRLAAPLWSQCQRYMSQHRCVDCFREGVDAADARKAESASISALLIQQLEATECR